MSKPSSFVAQYTLAITRLLEAADQVRSLDQQYVAVDMGSQLTDDHTTPQELTKAQFIDGISAARQVEAVIQTNKTNLYRLKQG